MLHQCFTLVTKAEQGCLGVTLPPASQQHCAWYTPLAAFHTLLCSCIACSATPQAGRCDLPAGCHLLCAPARSRSQRNFADDKRRLLRACRQTRPRPLKQLRSHTAAMPASRAEKRAAVPLLRAGSCGGRCRRGAQERQRGATLLHGLRRRTWPLGRGARRGPGLRAARSLLTAG